MRYVKKLALGVLACSMLASCAFDKSENDPNRQRDLNNREKLLRAYQSIQGVYEGTFVTPARTEEVRLTLSYTEVVVGKNEDGEIRYQPELRAKFTRLSRDLLDTYMAATYIEERTDGNLTLTTEANGGDDLYIRGSIMNNVFTAPILSRGQELGRMVVNLVSREVVAPADGTDNETYDRIKARLQPYIGEYLVKVNPLRGGHDGFSVDLLIRMEDTTVNGLLVPVLASYSRRSDGVSTIVRHGIQFDSSRSPVRLTFSPAAGATGYSNWQLTAPYVDNGFKGTAIYPVYPADFVAKRRPGSDRGSIGAPDGKTPTPEKPTPPKKGKR